jgi:hypothetical protein
MPIDKLRHVPPIRVLRRRRDQLQHPIRKIAGIAVAKVVEDDFQGEALVDKRHYVGRTTAEKDGNTSGDRENGKLNRIIPAA